MKLLVCLTEYPPKASGIGIVVKFVAFSPIMFIKK